jgi:thiosulfate reductase cytochrome b subunit
MTPTNPEDPPPVTDPPLDALPPAAAAAPAPPVKPRTVLVRRHSLAVRLTHWTNVVALTFLLLSGLQIFNAHPALYWGNGSTFARPWLSMRAYIVQGGHWLGWTTLGPWHFDTTGLFGASQVHGAWQGRAFPAWITLPSERFLALGRRYHFFFAWIFVINGAVYLLSGLLSGHLRRDLVPTRDQLKPRHVWHEIVEHARLRFPKGEEARHYNVLQKGAYAGVALVLLPLMVLTGMTMSPSLDASFPWLLVLFGGRQSARSIHFICANLIVLFVAVHLFMVLVSGLWNNIRSMITGRYAIQVERGAGEAGQ